MGYVSNLKNEVIPPDLRLKTTEDDEKISGKPAELGVAGLIPRIDGMPQSCKVSSKYLGNTSTQPILRNSQKDGTLVQFRREFLNSDMTFLHFFLEVAIHFMICSRNGNSW